MRVQCVSECDLKVGLSDNHLLHTQHGCVAPTQHTYHTTLVLWYTNYHLSNTQSHTDTRDLSHGLESILGTCTTNHRMLGLHSSELPKKTTAQTMWVACSMLAYTFSHTHTHNLVLDACIDYCQQYHCNPINSRLVQTGSCPFSLVMFSNCVRLKLIQFDTCNMQKNGSLTMSSMVTSIAVLLVLVFYDSNTSHVFF